MGGPAESRLSPAAVIDAATPPVAESGCEALSMRTLGERCGVSAMTQFEHVVKLGGSFLLRHCDRQFEDGLALLIDGLERRARAGRRSSPGDRGGARHNAS